VLRWTGSGERLFPVEHMELKKDRKRYFKEKAI
jgi:hypothetical protein